MPNHVHLLAVPPKETSLAAMMHATTFVYTRYFNRRYGREGHLWGNRFYSSVVDTDAYHWTAALYVEQNPVRAELVPSAELYAYSSARSHDGDAKDALLTSSLFDEFEREQYRKALRDPLGEEELCSARENLLRGKPFGNSRFIKALHRLLGVPLPPALQPQKGKKLPIRTSDKKGQA
jgi:putative transposase